LTYLRHRMMKWFSVWLMICVCFATPALAQVLELAHDDGKAIFKSSLLAKQPARISHQKGVHYHWEFLGPSAQPREDEASGTGIPAYARRRGSGTGRINYLYAHRAHAELLWACSPTGGLWYTTDEGAHWREGGTDALPVSGVSSIAVNESNPREWVIATGDGDDQFTATNGLWYTRNAGKSYSCINGDEASTALPFHLLESPTFIGEIVAHPQQFRRMLVASTKGLWVCEDIFKRTSDFGPLGWLFGRTKRVPQWKRVAQSQCYDIEWLHGFRDGEVVAVGGEQFLLSMDGGITWEEQSMPDLSDLSAFPFRRMTLQYAESMPGFLHIMITCSEAVTASKLGPARLYLYDVVAKSWQFIRAMDGDVTNVIPTRGRAFAVSDLNPQWMACANVQPVNISVTGGKTFEKIAKNQMHDDVHHLLWSAREKALWACHDGGVSVSYDRGVSWEPRDNGIGAANVFGVSVSQSKDVRIAYGGYDVGGNYLRDGTWRHVSWGDGFETIISHADRDVVFTTSQNGGMQAAFDGHTFDEAIRPNAKSEWHTWIRMHPTQPNTIYCSGERLMRSVDLGESWQPIFDCKKIDSTAYNAYRFFLSPEHPQTIYVYVLTKGNAASPQLWVTHNVLEQDAQNVNWKRLAYVPIEGWIAGLCVDPQDAHKFWVLYTRRERDGKLWYFDGKSYQDQTRELADAYCESMVLEAGADARLYIGSDQGVYTKTRNEPQWTLLSGLPGVAVKSLAINYATRKIIAGTFGRGIWQADLHH
jgi:hypothetical protein